METNDALFPALLKPAWHDLPGSVRAMHGATPRILARGKADVEGDGNVMLRTLRWLLKLPPPGPEQALELCIERQGHREIWTRRFARGQMQSTLRHDATATHLWEQLGAVTLRFTLRPDADGVAWQLNGARVLGIPVPRSWLGTVHSHSGERDGRYAFTVDTRLPWLGRLVAYRGWLEIVTDD
ncbi:DUF4166 domain-containing protein [Dyella sp.]|uniref:DUF4166 domain-containing protein n=1 Tax=Dyella sp. TaxID=1869338 RepID=UPI002FD9ACD0